MDVPFIPETVRVIHKAPSTRRRWLVCGEKKKKKTHVGRLHADAQVIYASVCCHYGQMRGKNVQPLALFEAPSLSSESQVFIELSLGGGPSRRSSSSFSSYSSSSSPHCSLTRLHYLLLTLVISITFYAFVPLRCACSSYISELNFPSVLSTLLPAGVFCYDTTAVAAAYSLCSNFLFTDTPVFFSGLPRWAFLRGIWGVGGCCLKF